MLPGVHGWEPALKLRTQVSGLNDFLTSMYGAEMRVSTLLARLGFSADQVELLRNDYLEHVVHASIAHLQGRVASSRDGDRLYQVVSRRFGLDGDPTETLDRLGTTMGVSGERVRELQQQAVRRCRRTLYRALFESELRNVASGLVGHPRGGIVAGSSEAHPDGNYETTIQPVEARPDTGKVADGAEVEGITNGVTAILWRVPAGLSCNLLAHVLAGSKGPVVDALVGHYHLSEFGASRALGYTRTKELVRSVVSTAPDLELRDGTVRLRSAGPHPVTPV